MTYTIYLDEDTVYYDAGINEIDENDAEDDANLSWNNPSDNSWQLYADDDDDPVKDVFGTGGLTVNNLESNYVVIGGQTDRNEFESLEFNFNEDGGVVVFKNVELTDANTVNGSDDDDYVKFTGDAEVNGSDDTVSVSLKKGSDSVKVADSQVEDSSFDLGDDKDDLKLVGEAILDGTTFKLGGFKGGPNREGDGHDDIVKFKPGFTGTVDGTELEDFEAGDELNLAGVVYKGSDLKQDIAAIGYEYSNGEGQFTSGLYEGMMITFV